MTVERAEAKSELPEDFIDVALELIEREGWEAASLERMAEFASVDLAVVLRVYPSREFFAAAVVERLFARLPAEFADEIDERSDLRARLFTIIAHELRSMMRYKRFMRALLSESINPLSYSALAQLPTVARYSAFVAEQIQVARMRGEISRFVVPTIAAAAFWLVHLRIVAFWTEDVSEQSEESFALADRNITYFVRALGGSVERRELS